MKEEMKNLYFAVLLSAVAMFLVSRYFRGNEAPQAVSAQEQVAAVEHENFIEQATEIVPEQEEDVSYDERISFENGAIEGSIRLRGARFDDLFLRKYKQTLEENSPNVELFSSENPYYMQFGWLGNGVKTPDENTPWKVKGEKLTPQTPVVLEWNNGEGLRFVNKISLDENYLFQIEQIVENNTQNEVELFPYALITKKLGEENSATRVVHRGMIGVFNDKLEESDQKSYAQVKNSVVYNCNNKLNDEEIEVSLNLTTKSNQTIINNSDNNGHSLEERIANIKEVLGAFRSSKFIKNLKDCQPVRSPIRKTNVILKEQNFVKALELWEYLESNAIRPFTNIERNTIDRSNEAKNKFDLALFVQTKALELEQKEQDNKGLQAIDYIGKLVNDIVNADTVTESELKRIISKEYQAAFKRKKKQEEGIKKCFEDVIKVFDKRKQKAINIIK